MTLCRSRASWYTQNGLNKTQSRNNTERISITRVRASLSDITGQSAAIITAAAALFNQLISFSPGTLF